MQIAYSFLAILTGFITIVGLIGIATALLKRFAPNLTSDDAPPDPFIMAVNVAIGLDLLTPWRIRHWHAMRTIIHSFIRSCWRWRYCC